MFEKILIMKSGITSHVDNFVVLHQRLEVELLAMRSRHDRLESQLFQLATKLNVQLT